MKRAAFHNLGCKVNSYEMDIMRQKMEESGYITVPFEEKADVYVINTCTVTNIADRKSRQMIHRAKKRNPKAVVVAVGCYVETDPGRVGIDPSIDLAIGNNKKAQIAEILEEYFLETEREDSCRRQILDSEPGQTGFLRRTQDDESDQTGFRRRTLDGESDQTGFHRRTLDTELDRAGFRQRTLDIELDQAGFRRRTLGGRTMSDLTHRPEYEDMQLEDPGHTRAFIKIQDGCNQFCTYCIIPYARGRIRSRRPDEILKEIRTVAQKGIHEVVLTGIHVSSYGLEWDAKDDAVRDDSGESEETRSVADKSKAVRFDPIKSGANLLDLLGRIREIPGIERIRLSSLEPRIITETFVQGIAAMPEVCPHFHLSLQSGCDATLKRMNRHYTTEEFLEGVNLLRQYFDDPAITTDVIVGFPGETEEEFAQTVQFLETVNFYEMHVFKYSARKGTVAAAMPGQIPESVKSVRSDVLLAMTARQSAEFRERFIGKQEELLLEEQARLPFGLCWRGHTKRYVEGYIRCVEDSLKEVSSEEAFSEKGDFCGGQLVCGNFMGPAEGTEGLMFEVIGG